MTARHDAATAIQRVFRGWRTRKRVVWDVGEEMTQWMTALDLEMEMESVRLGLAKPQTFVGWALGEGVLRLPRVHDVVFGVASVYPPVQMVDCVQKAASERVGSPDEASERNDKEQDAAFLKTIAGGDNTGNVCESPIFSDSEKRVACDAEEAAVVSFVGSHDSDQDGVVMETEEQVASEDNKTTTVTDSTDSPVHAPSTSSTLAVEQIIKTHTKEEIRMELQWAQQALRDRLEYLQAQHRRRRREH
ncbi:hypothetical protein Poli38472_006215 [Pythium oligandrum]|uniref:Uncharacterized protein n=1 Tax=Pythium oligandrum TaxID=41045 RepID=A0A8K1FR91_PYTOL|nr:hypothetical protein Poli38472_006215 [Pythium oligandrum]|eukprot:TMW68747.1 hypothetical protein Poli38472_006215 [Pythium oligandrum]